MSLVTRLLVSFTRFFACGEMWWRFNGHANPPPLQTDSRSPAKNLELVWIQQRYRCIGMLVPYNTRCSRSASVRTSTPLHQRGLSPTTTVTWDRIEGTFSDDILNIPLVSVRARKRSNRLHLRPRRYKRHLWNFSPPFYPSDSGLSLNAWWLTSGSWFCVTAWSILGYRITKIF